MNQLFSTFFHKISKDKGRGHPPISADFRDWPEEWRTVYYKKYPRFKQIDLLKTNPTFNLFDAIRGRVTNRIINGKKITLNQLSILLEYSAGITSFVNGMNHRAYPSGGARYPLEVYFLVTETIDTDISPGLYHYDVENHRATVLWERDFEKPEISKYLGVSWVERGSLIFFITATFERNQLKYGERGYRMVLIEAGHVGQGLYLNSKALGLNCCALAATEDVMVEDEILDIDGVGESLVYTLIVG